MATRRASASAFRKHTVNEPDEPSPVPAGTSATTLTSSGSPFQWRSNDSLRIGWRISRGVVDLLELGVLHPVAALEDGVGEHVDVLVDRPADEEAAVLAVVRGEVGSASAEAHAQRRSTEDDAHAAARSSRKLGFCSSQSTVRLIASRMGNVGRQPSAANPLAVEVDQRAVTEPPADAPRVLELGCDAEVCSDRRDRVVDDDGFVGPEVVDPDALQLRAAAPSRASSPRRSLRRRDTTSPADRRRARASGTDPCGGCDRSRRRARACSARRGSRRSER